MEGKEWRIKKVERRTHYIGNTRGSVKTSGKGRFENMRVDREGGICAFGQVFAHADQSLCLWTGFCTCGSVFVPLDRFLHMWILSGVPGA